MRWRIPLLVAFALFVAVSCDLQSDALPSEPAGNADASFDITTAGLVTNTLQIALKCSAGVVGSAGYSLQPTGTSFGLACPADVHTHDAAGISGFRVGFFAIVNAPEECDATVFFPAAGFPTRTKCTVNGRDVGGKPIATVVMKYVRD